MECNSDLDSNSESDYNPDNESATEFDEEEVDQLCNLEPEPSAPTNTKNQLKAQINSACLAQLHATGQSKHTVKMKNKPVSEGFKLWVLYCYSYTWDFLFYSCISDK